MADIGKIKVGTTTYDINAYKVLSKSANSAKYLEVYDKSDSSGISIGTNTQDDDFEIWSDAGIYLRAGQQDHVYINTSTHKVSLSTGNLTADRAVNFPDKDGTIAMTSDLGDQVTFSLSNGVLTITPKS